MDNMNIHPTIYMIKINITKLSSIHLYTQRVLYTSDTFFHQCNFCLTSLQTYATTWFKAKTTMCLKIHLLASHLIDLFSITLLNKIKHNM